MRPIAMWACAGVAAALVACSEPVRTTENCGQAGDTNSNGRNGCADSACELDPRCTFPIVCLDEAIRGALYHDTMDADHLGQFAFPSEPVDVDGDAQPEVAFAITYVQAPGTPGSTVVGGLLGTEQLSAGGPLVLAELESVIRREGEAAWGDRAGMVVMDLDADGHLDLLLTHPFVQPALAVWYGDGGAWPPAPRDPDLEVFAGSAGYSEVMDVGDLNGDGHPDLAVRGVGFERGVVGLLPGGKRYTSIEPQDFFAHVTWGLLQEGGDYGWLDEPALFGRVGDMVGEAGDDLLVQLSGPVDPDDYTSDLRPTVYLVPGEALTGTEELDAVAAARFTLPGRDDGAKLARRIAVGDLDGDGTDDLVMSDPKSGFFFNGYNTCAAGFAIRGKVPQKPEVGQQAIVLEHYYASTDAIGHDVAVFDLDGDQYDDVLVTGRTGLPYSAWDSKKASDTTVTQEHWVIGMVWRGGEDFFAVQAKRPHASPNRPDLLLTTVSDEVGKEAQPEYWLHTSVHDIRLLPDRDGDGYPELISFRDSYHFPYMWWDQRPFALRMTTEGIVQALEEL